MEDLSSDIEAMQQTANYLIEFFIRYGFQIFGALLILVVGWYLAKWAGRLVQRLCEKLKLDVTLSKFFAGLAKTVVMVFVVIIAMGKFGISIAPFIAALGAITFGSTLALQGPISNYGAGITIILTRPFIVGDTIKVQNVIGVVDEIKLAYTLLSSEDGELITIPNKHIVGEIIHNSAANLVVESVVGIAYDSDINKAIAAIEKVLADTNGIAATPAPQVGIDQFGDYAIQVAYRYWVPTRSYYETKFSVNKAVMESLQAAAINIPLPSGEVKIINKDGLI